MTARENPGRTLVSDHEIERAFERMNPDQRRIADAVFQGRVDEARQLLGGRARSLLRGGVKINTRLALRMTPLILAAAKGNVAMVDALIALGANLEVKDKEGATALMLATQ